MAKMKINYELNIDGIKREESLTEKEKKIRSLRKELRGLRKRAKLDREIARLEKKLSRYHKDDENSVIDVVEVEITDN